MTIEQFNCATLYRVILELYEALYKFLYIILYKISININIFVHIKTWRTFDFIDLKTTLILKIRELL